MNIDMTLGDTALIVRKAKDYGCSRPQIAYILATAYWETAKTMKPVREAFWLSEQWRKDNLRYYPFYGRGYVQITWRENYEKAGRKLGRNLVDNHDAVMEPEVASEILVRGCMEGWFTGKSIPDYIDDEHVDFWNARRVVNGTDRADEIARLAKDYNDALINSTTTKTETEQHEAPGVLFWIFELIGRILSVLVRK